MFSTIHSMLTKCTHKYFCLSSVHRRVGDKDTANKSINLWDKWEYNHPFLLFFCGSKKMMRKSQLLPKLLFKINSLRASGPV